MSDDFYTCTPEQQGERLRTLAMQALRIWDLDDTAQVELIKHRENAVFSVSTADARYALRVHRADYHTDQELASELQWIEAINSDELRTPQAIRTPSGELFSHVSADGVPEPRQVDLLEWFAGKPMGSVEDGLAEEVEDVGGLFHEIGRLMAVTHNHSNAWTPPADFTRHAWDEEGLLGEAPFWGRFWELDALSDAQRATLLKVRARTRDDLAAFGKTPDRYGLIHADFVPENLLIDGDDICLIDFDDSGFGWHMFDIATTLFFFMGESFFEAAVAGFIEGYRGARPLADEQLQQLPLFMLLRGTTYLGWVHTRSETDTAKEMTPMIVEAVEALAREYLDE